MTYTELNHRVHERLKTVSLSQSGQVIVFTWAIAEATFWFIAPDFIIGLLVVIAPASWLILVRASLFGSLVGGLLSYGLNLLYPEWMAQILHSTPFVQQSMIEFVDGVYTKHGHAGVLFQAFSFMQFKIWTQAAVKFDFNAFVYFSFVMISRSIRFGASAWLAKIIGSRIEKFLKDHIVLFSILYTLTFIGLLVMLEGRS
ncbi:MAG: hypothetical protein NT027_15200 [Proteobacteria bacterium]|nr:hypothetical protein [Pseudomonadota bacterium]